MEIKAFIVGVLVTASLLFIKNYSSGNSAQENTPKIPEERNIDNEQEEIDKIKEKEEELRRKNRPQPASRSIISRSVPRNNTNMKTYMDYRAITSKNSPQYKLQQSEKVYTDEEGFRRIEDKFIVAVGTYFTTEIGKEIEVQLDTGEYFKAIVGDLKADIHTDSDNIQHMVDKSVVEFIVDTRQLHSMIKRMGDCSYSELNRFKGDVVNINIFED